MPNRRAAPRVGRCAARELDRLQEIEFNKDGRQIIMRTPAVGIIGPLFKAARVALPANIREPDPT